MAICIHSKPAQLLLLSAAKCLQHHRVKMAYWPTWPSTCYRTCNVTLHRAVLTLASVLQNPEIGNNEPPNAGLSHKAEYKGSQQKQFGGYRWIACHDASLLDAERCEFIFIGATEDLQGRATWQQCSFILCQACSCC